MLTGKILITGGAGTLGSAIIKRAFAEKWDCEISIFSTDPAKHSRVKYYWPKVQAIVGDIRDFTTLYNAMVGKDLVIHAAAVKRIPESEYNSLDAFNVNVEGSINICQAAMQLNTPRVLGITTDKACRPANAYGCTKMMMEKAFQEFSRLGLPTQYNLVRYGNVLESTGSVVEAWKKAVERGEPIKITDPAMTRFWLSPSQAVDYVLNSLEFESGQIYIPKMPALSIGKMAAYTLDFDPMWLEEVQPYHIPPNSGFPKCGIEHIPLRPGEKKHETLLTLEELDYAYDCGDYFELHPTTGAKSPTDRRPKTPYSSDIARELTKTELMELLND